MIKTKVIISCIYHNVFIIQKISIIYGLNTFKTINNTFKDKAHVRTYVSKFLFCKEPDNKYCRVSGPYNYVATPLFSRYSVRVAILNVRVLLYVWILKH